ncbi:MAG: hypothetical protein HQL46_16385 [Gammaproteobacteria bacterium]|nr:hypothetical protein [Gammaproteobacteria bacterium]
MENYLSEAKHNWKKKTLCKTEQDYRPKLKLFIAIVGNKPVNQITFDSKHYPI